MLELWGRRFVNDQGNDSKESGTGVAREIVGSNPIRGGTLFLSFLTNNDTLNLWLHSKLSPLNSNITSELTSEAVCCHKSLMSDVGIEPTTSMTRNLKPQCLALRIIISFFLQVRKASLLLSR